MKKMLKIMAMLLVIATVVFAAGCSDNKAATPETGATGQVTEQTPIAGEEGTHGEVTATAPEAENVAGTPGNESIEPGNESMEPGNESMEPGNESMEPGNNTTEPGNNSSDVDEGDLNENEIPDPTPE